MANLQDSVKTPIIIIYDVNGQELITSFGEAGMSVVDMRYLYDDEDDDICKIKIQADKVNPLDLINITYGTNLVVQWGYAGGPVSPKATVVVRDIKTKYGADIIWVDLECTDYVTYLKTSKGDSSDQVTILEYLAIKSSSERGYSYKVVIKEFGNIVYKQSKEKLPEKETEWHTGLKYEGPNFDPWEDGAGLIKKVIEKIFDDATKTQINPPPSNGEIYLGISDELSDFLNKERNFTDGNRSPYQVLRDVFKYAPNGPWYISGRGDTILIHNRYLGSVPLKTYNYNQEPGYLIDLDIASKYEAFEQRSVSSPYMSPEEKIAYYEDIYIKELENLQDLNKIITDKSISKYTRRQLLTNFLATYRASHIYRVQRLDLMAYRAGGYVKGNLFPADQKYTTGQFIIDDPSKNLIEGHVAPVGMVYDPNFIPEFQTPIPFHVYMLAGQTSDERRDMIDNIAREAEMDKIEANMIIEGDPILITETIVRLGNIQEVHSGDYYIKKAEHVITKQGYKTNCEAFKIMPKAALMGISQTARQAIVDENGNIIEGGEGQEVIDRFHREEALFNGWNLQIYVSTQTAAGIGIGVPLSKIDIYIPLSDFILEREGVPLDELVEEIEKRHIRESRETNVEDR